MSAARRRCDAVIFSCASSVRSLLISRELTATGPDIVAGGEGGGGPLSPVFSGTKCVPSLPFIISQQADSYNGIE